MLATIDEKVLAVRQIERAIRMGPRELGQDEALAIARQDLGQARTAYATVLEPLEGSTNTLLSDSQQAAWAAIQSGHGQSMPIRMLALSDEQRLDVGRAWRHYRWQQGAASTAEQRAAAVNAWETALGQILSVDQENVVNAYHGYYADASGAVAGAFDTVLAVDQG